MFDDFYWGVIFGCLTSGIIIWILSNIQKSIEKFEHSQKFENSHQNIDPTLLQPNVKNSQPQTNYNLIQNINPNIFNSLLTQLMPGILQNLKPKSEPIIDDNFVLSSALEDLESERIFNKKLNIVNEKDKIKLKIKSKKQKKTVDEAFDDTD